MIKITKMTMDCIWFIADEVHNKKFITVYLPAMPSYPDGYAIDVYGDLGRHLDGALYLSDLRTVDPTDFIIYQAFVEYLEQEKKNEESAAGLLRAMTRLVESGVVLSTKINELHDNIQSTKNKLLLDKMNTPSKTLH